MYRIAVFCSFSIIFNVNKDVTTKFFVYLISQIIIFNERIESKNSN